MWVVFLLGCWVLFDVGLFVATLFGVLACVLVAVYLRFAAWLPVAVRAFASCACLLDG